MTEKSNMKKIRENTKKKNKQTNKWNKTFELSLLLYNSF